MKKIILGIVFVFTSVAMVNANTETTESILVGSCFDNAWRYGVTTAASYGGDEQDEWFWMDVYYKQFCEMQ